MQIAPDRLRVSIVSPSNLPPFGPSMQGVSDIAEIQEPQFTTEDELVGAISSTEIIVPRGEVRKFFNKRVLAQLANVKAIITSGVGHDGIDVEAATEFKIPVATTVSFCSAELTEQAVALIFAAARKVCPMDKAMRNNESPNAARALHDATSLGYSPMYRLKGKVAGIIGFGRSGREIAKVLKSLGLQVIVYDHNAEKKRDAFSAAGVEAVSLQELLGLSDVVTLHLPLTKDSYHLLDEKELGIMKRTSILVNVSRGAIVNEEALYRCLKEGRIMAAGLDVFENEPFTPANPLTELDNVVLSPHLGAVSVESLEDRLGEIASNIRRIYNGQAPANVVNPSVLLAPH